MNEPPPPSSLTRQPDPSMLSTQGKYAEADPLYLRVIGVMEKALGPDHPNVAICLHNRALLLGEQVCHVWKSCILLLPWIGGIHPTTAVYTSNGEMLFSDDCLVDGEAWPCVFFRAGCVLCPEVAFGVFGGPAKFG